MNKETYSEVIVYHDETKYQNLKGHVLFLVPVKITIREKGNLLSMPPITFKPLTDLFDDIEKVRNNFGANHKFHFSEISGQKWTKQNNAEKNIVQIAVEYLKQKNTFCKLGVIFYEEPKLDLISSYGGENRKEKELRFGETLLRMLLKGTLHYLYDNKHKVKILKIITDGQPCHRKLNEFRIIYDLRKKVRSYVEIPDTAELVHLNSDHKKYVRCSEEYKHANILQLADMLLGSVVQSCFKETKLYYQKNPRVGDRVEDKKAIISYPVKLMLEKFKRGKNFKYSKHFKAFTISKANIRNGEWKFENIWEFKNKMTQNYEILEKEQLRIFP